MAKFEIWGNKPKGNFGEEYWLFFPSVQTTQEKQLAASGKYNSIYVIKKYWVPISQTLKLQKDFCIFMKVWEQIK